MTIHTNPSDRKAMVHALSEHMQTPAVYMRTPTYAFQIGGLTVNRDGSITGEDEALLESLRPLLVERGWLNAEVEPNESVEDSRTTVDVSAVDKLTEVYKRCQSDPRNTEWYRLEAFESCPGLTELWTQPFMAKYTASDGAVTVRFKTDAEGTIHMAAGMTEK